MGREWKDEERDTAIGFDPKISVEELGTVSLHLYTKMSFFRGCKQPHSVLQLVLTDIWRLFINVVETSNDF